MSCVNTDFIGPKQSTASWFGPALVDTPVDGTDVATLSYTESTLIPSTALSFTLTMVAGISGIIYTTSCYYVLNGSFIFFILYMLLLIQLLF